MHQDPAATIGTKPPTTRHLWTSQVVRIVMVTKRPLRIAYVGPTMDLFLKAYAEEHLALGHDIELLLRPEQIKAIVPGPDVVISSPLARRNRRQAGSCLLHTLVQPTTLIVALFTSEGASHAMFAKHALEGRCHQRMLLHCHDPSLSADRIVAKIDWAARGGTNSKAMATTSLPSVYLLDGATQDLGQLMNEDRQLAEFLYRAAIDRSWSTWGDLASLLHISEGSAKNRMSKFGKKAAEVGLIPADISWTMGQFVRFVTEHQSFIQAYRYHNLEANLDAVGATDKSSETQIFVDESLAVDAPLVP